MSSFVLLPVLALLPWLAMMPADPVTAPRFVYVALGDSTGVGTGARHGGYVTRLLERLRGVRPQADLVNLCVGGATVDDALRIQVAKVPSAAALVTVSLGINDASAEVGPGIYRAKLDQLIRAVRTRTAAVIVLSNVPDMAMAPALPARHRGEVTRRLMAYNAGVNEVAKAHGLAVFDAYRMTRDVVPRTRDFFSSDGFHPSDVGYQAWADALWPVVRQALPGPAR